MKKMLVDYKTLYSRSRKGAWIEIDSNGITNVKRVSRSRKGAWIEIIQTYTYQEFQPGRSRKGAWIEISRGR